MKSLGKVISNFKHVQYLLLDDAKANDDVFAQTEIRHLVKVPKCEESEEGVSRKTRKALKGVIRRFLRKKNDDG